MNYKDKIFRVKKIFLKTIARRSFWVVLFLVFLGVVVFLVFAAKSGEFGKKNEELAKQTTFNVQQSLNGAICATKYLQRVGKVDNSKLGWVSDIHADRFKKRDVESGLLYPKKYAEYLPKVFEELQKQGVYTVVATGDNTNSGNPEYARQIAKIASKKCMQVIWVKGNHDSQEAMNVLNSKKQQHYYFEDFENVRVIALDNTEDEKGGYLGGVGLAQKKWLHEALKTNKKIIVAMHIPMFFEGKLTENYNDLEKEFIENGNVKIVLSGHYHVPSQIEQDGIKFYTEGALTYDGSEGAYAIIDQNDFSVNYLFAK